MATFGSSNETHAISHPSLKAAAGDQAFVVQFVPPGVFETQNKAIASALDALIASGGLSGVKRIDAPPAPDTGAPTPQPTTPPADSKPTKPKKGE